MRTIAVGTGTLGLADGNGTRVLIVEDHVDTADLFAGILVARGYSVVVLTDGATAVAEAARFDPHIALLDLGLPTVSGYEIAGSLRAVAPHVRLAAITGYGQIADRERAQRCGFEVHMLKPIGLRQLLDMVASLRTPA